MGVCGVWTLPECYPACWWHPRLRARHKTPSACPTQHAKRTAAVQQLPCKSHMSMPARMSPVPPRPSETVFRCRAGTFLRWVVPFVA